MYNDYYLQQIDNKISITNSNLEDIIANQQSIINNQATIIANQIEDISGDKNIIENTRQTYNATMLVATIGILFLLVKVIERCLR